MKFPDEYFPVKQELAEDFKNKVNKGREASRDLKILFFIVFGKCRRKCVIDVR